MKTLVALAALLGLTLAHSAYPQELKPGNWTIYFEPTAVLQTGTHVPFRITVNDPLHKPVVEARVTLQIETPDHLHVQVFKAPAIDQGVYLAKPDFPFAGQWSVLVEVHREDRQSARTIEYNVPK